MPKFGPKMPCLGILDYDFKKLLSYLKLAPLNLSKILSFSEGLGPGPLYKVCGYKASINSVSKLGSFNYKTELKLDCFVTSSKTLNLLKFGK